MCNEHYETKLHLDTALRTYILKLNYFQNYVFNGATWQACQIAN